jgi:hypothetical protein
MIALHIWNTNVPVTYLGWWYPHADWNIVNVYTKHAPQTSPEKPKGSYLTLVNKVA